MTLVLRDVADGIGAITLNRPEQMNALTVALSGELERAILEMGSDPAVNVVVVQGAGGNFCAGGDFNEVELLRSSGPDALRSLFEAFRRACDAIARVEVPVIAAVEGVAMAGGFELMQAADITLACDDARISDNHIRFGQVPGGGSTQRLPRLVGRQRALGLLLSGDRLDGLEAVRLGLAYRSWPAEAFEGEVAAFIETLASRRRDALARIKRLVREGLEGNLAAGLQAELDAVVEHIAGAAGGAGVTAFSMRSS